MADIELVIKIPEWKYKSICEGVEASKRCGVVGIDPDIHEAIYNGIPLPENYTNGDMIKALFPNLIYKDGSQTERLFDNDDLIIGDLFNEWWNAPYKKEADKEQEEERV